jgi:ribose transport system substrate-binding protein
MKGSRTTVPAVAVLAAAALAGAALAGTSARSSHAKSITIGVAMPESNDQFYEVIGAGIKAEAKRLHVKANFVFAQNDAATQDQQVRNFVAQKVNAILISPVDANALAPSYQWAQAHHVPIISIARNLANPKYESAFVGADWHVYGTKIAKWTCGHVKSGKVAMLLGPAGASFVEDMKQTYVSYLKSKCARLKIVFQQNIAHLTPDASLPVAQNALTANPDLKVIYANNDGLAAGAVKAIQQRHRVGKVTITGFDGDPIGFQNIKAGTQAMTVALRPQHWGALGVDTVVKWLSGKKPAHHLVPIVTILIDKSNINKYSQKALG